MPYSFDIYIGSDNGSKRIHKHYLNKIEQWANSSFPDGFTLIRGKGYYRGVTEDSVVINVLSDYELSLQNQINSLKQILSQEAILVAKSRIDLEVL